MDLSRNQEKKVVSVITVSDSNCLHFSSPEPKAQKVSLYDGHAPSSVVVVVVVHTFQRSSPLKSLVQSMPNFMWNILRKVGLKFV